MAFGVRRVALGVAALAIFAAPAFAVDYFVTVSGDDRLDGQSLATAWATLGHAANVVNPGDVVHVSDGAYQGFYLSRSGTAGNPITFVADSANVQITADNGTTPDGINVEGAAYIVIDGFTVNNRTRAGIRVAVSQFVTVRNCHTGNNGRWGIFSGFADDFTIENNETHHSVAEHGIYVSNSCVRPVIRGNVSHDNNANGIHMNGDLSQGGTGLIANALVERNIIYGNGAGGGSGINMDGVINSTIRDNLLYDNHASGISLYRIDAASGSTGNVVVNNTIINAADGRWCVNVNNGSTGNTVLNNILYNYHPFRGAISVDPSSQTDFVSDYNSVIDRFSADAGNTVIALTSWQALGYDAHSFVATPPQLFLMPGSDFHLLPGAPATDAGTATDAPSFDLEGNPRPVGAGYDIGAYENQLLHCGNGVADPGEQCGEPGLACTDACTSCNHCICALNAPVCGDGIVCGNEQCETDTDCPGGQVCQSCQCINRPLCNSGIAMQKATLTLRAAPFALQLAGRAVIPQPWQAVDPISNGVHVVVDAVTGSGGIDALLPGGALSGRVGWRVNRGNTQWTYTDPIGSHAGITRMTLLDRSHTTPGLISWTVQGHSPLGITLPNVREVRAAVVVGAPAECAAIQWNPPGATRPRCDGNGGRISCR